MGSGGIKIETVRLSIQNMFKLMGKKIITKHSKILMATIQYKKGLLCHNFQPDIADTTFCQFHRLLENDYIFYIK